MRRMNPLHHSCFSWYSWRSGRSGAVCVAGCVGVPTLPEEIVLHVLRRCKALHGVAYPGLGFMNQRDHRSFLDRDERDRAGLADWRWSRRLAVYVSILFGVLLAGYGIVGSYATVSALAAEHHVPLAALVPLGIDGGLVGVVVLDLVLSWMGSPVAWLRQVARLLMVGTVVANAAAGWPDTVAVGLHCAAPVMLLAMVEAGRSVLLRRVTTTNGAARETIPWERWMLSPWRTLLLWRRMVLWRTLNYDKAIETELAVRRAVAILRARHGRRWRREAPADVVWMLRTGERISEACAWVEGSARYADTADAGDPSHRDTWQESDPGTGSEVDTTEDQLAQATKLNRQHWFETGRPISAETVRKALRVSSARSRDLARSVRDADRITLCSR